jgi:hypothetical protein
VCSRPALLQFHDSIYQTAHSIIISKCCTHYGCAARGWPSLTTSPNWCFLSGTFERAERNSEIAICAAVRSILTVTSVLVLFAVAHRQCLRERKSGPKSCLRNKVINPGNCFALYIKAARESMGLYKTISHAYRPNSNLLCWLRNALTLTHSVGKVGQPHIL